jgi:hypothetical protein
MISSFQRCDVKTVRRQIGRLEQGSLFKREHTKLAKQRESLETEEKARTMAHLPFFKLGVLLVKQATKPMARAIKSRAQASDTFSKICEFFGQQWHVQTTKLNLVVQGHKVKGVKPLNEQEAVQSGAELIAEGFVLSVGVSALIVESRRSANAAADKAQKKAERQQQKMEAMQHLNDTVRDLAWFSMELRKSIAEAEKARKDADRLKKPMPSIILPSVPASVAEIVGGTDTPTDVVVAAHNKDVEREDWSRSLLQRLTVDSAASVIKWVGSIVNGGDDGEDDDSGDSED